MKNQFCVTSPQTSNFATFCHVRQNDRAQMQKMFKYIPHHLTSYLQWHEVKFWIRRNLIWGHPTGPRKNETPEVKSRSAF